MNKKLKYILDTIRAKFDTQVKVINSRVKWIRYALMPSNYIEVKDSTISHIGIGCKGENNRVQFLGGANLCYSNIGITGNDNTVIFDGCSGIVSLTIRGNNHVIKIGKNTTIEEAYMVSMGNGNCITIGEDCMFSGKVEIWNTDSHLITDLQGEGINPSKPIVIGNHVWIGKHVKILKGVHIADNSVIGMSAVVTMDVPQNSIVAGNPAKKIKSGVLWHKGFIEI